MKGRGQMMKGRLLVIAGSSFFLFGFFCQPDSPSPFPPQPVASSVPDLTTSDLNPMPDLPGDIAFVAGHNSAFGSAAVRDRDVFTMRADGTALTRLTRDHLKDEFDPVIAPGGSKIYFACEDASVICRTNPDGSSREVVLQDDRASRIESLAISPDGNELLFIGTENADAANQPASLYRFTIATRALQAVDIRTSDGRDGNPHSATWTPEGGIVFSKYEDPPSTKGAGPAFLYHLPAGGSAPISLQPEGSGGPGIGTEPDVSPDGSKVVFKEFSGTQPSLYTMNIDGTGVQKLVDGQQPTWSPDGGRVAFIGPDPNAGSTDLEIFVVNANGTGVAQLTRNGVSERDPDWGELRISVSVDDVSADEGNAGNTNFTFQLSLSAPSTQQVTVLYRTTDGSARAGSDYDAKVTDAVIFAPGETKKTVVVSVKGDTQTETNESFYVELSNPSGGAVLGRAKGRGLIVNDDNPPSPTTTPSSSPSPTASPAVSPGRIVFVSATDAGVNQLFTMKADGSDVQHISTNQASSNLDDPSWSSDGTKIIHTALDGSQHELITRLAAPGGAFDPILHPSDDVEPAFRGGSTTEYWWSSNEHGDYDLFRGPGRNHMTTSASDERDVSFGNDPLKFVYEANYDGDYDIYLQELATSGANLAGSPQNLTQETGGTAANDVDPDLSADGSKVAFSRNGDIYVVNVATKVLTRVTSDAAAESDPTFSHDGHQIAFVRKIGNDTEIFRISASGGTAVNISNNPTGIDESPDWGPASTSAPRPEPSGTAALSVVVPLGFLVGVGLRMRRRSPFS